MHMGPTGPDRIERYRREFRGGLAALAAPLVAIGGWALLAPHSWYEDFPGGGRGWVSALGPYNEHLVRDFGALYLGLGLLLVFAGVTLGRQVVQASLGVLLVFSVPHFVYHLTELEALPTGDNIANMITLGLGVLLPAVLLWMSFGSAQKRASRTPSRRTAEPTIQEGMTYGTR
jgi:hypothetical protein